MSKKNIFASVLTNAAPSCNYRGESELNRTVLQKITKRGPNGIVFEYPVVSSESMRNALREILAKKGLPMNRSRLNNEGQLAVEFKAFPNSNDYADDFLFGFMVADPKAIKENKNLPSKRDSVFRMNIAVGLLPYNFDTMLHQSPLNAGNSPWKNSENSALLYHEVTYTPYQYPFALCLQDCSSSAKEIEWTKALINSIGELCDVAGGHARSYFEMAPKSIVVRLTSCLVGGFTSYGFDENGGFSELSRISQDDLPGNEFWVGGEIVRNMTNEERIKLQSSGVHLFESPQKLLSELSVVAFEEK
jgi:CRISPR-associated protein Cst2